MSAERMSTLATAEFSTQSCKSSAPPLALSGGPIVVPSVSRPSVCVLTRVLWPGGVQRVAIAEASRLSAIGYRVNLAFLRATDGGRKFVNLPPQVEVHIRKGRSSRLMRRLLRFVTLHYSPERGDDATVDLDLILRNEVNRPSYDFVIYNDQYAALFGSLGRFLHGGRVVVWIHESFLEHPSRLRRLIEAISLNAADLILTSADANRRILLRAGYADVFTLRLGCERVVEVPPFDQRENVAIAVTMWDHGRHPEALLDVAREMKSGRIILAGSWTRQSEMVTFQRFVIESQLADRLEVTGPIPDAQLSELYRRSKVFVRFGYDEKGPGMGCLEALRNGLPLIVNTGLGITEIVRNETNGVVVDAVDPRYVAAEIDSLFSDRPRWESISRANRALAETQSWESHATRLSSLLMAKAETRN